MRTKREIELDFASKGWSIYCDMDGIHITKRKPNCNRNYFVLDIYNKKFYSSCYGIEIEIIKLLNEYIECFLQRRKKYNENNN